MPLPGRRSLIAIIAISVALPATLRAQRGDVAHAIDAYVAPYVATNNFSGQHRAYWESIVILRDSTGGATGMTYDRFSGVRVVADRGSTRR